MPPEWAIHNGVWIGFPWDKAEWPVGLNEAQAEIAAFANSVFDDGAGETVTIVTGSKAAAERARALTHDGITVRTHPIGDSWLRDTGCIVVTDGRQNSARNFGFNGWGGKYLMAGDQEIGRLLAQEAALPVTDCQWILEGGAIDVDGSGMAVTTEQCMLHPNRNPNMNRADLEAALLRDLGITRTIWLGDGLAGDHTDGHVDNLARFVGPQHIVIPKAADDDDPNIAIYADAHKRASAFDLRVTSIPSPGYFTLDGKVTPASYMNFYIANSTIAVPAFDLPTDEAARLTIADLFPGRRAISLSSVALLRGGGSFHCCSQQIPA